MENLMEWRLAGETEVLGENLPQRHFVHLVMQSQTSLFYVQSKLGTDSVSSSCSHILHYMLSGP
jgi:hypothetical protein